MKTMINDLLCANYYKMGAEDKMKSRTIEIIDNHIKALEEELEWYQEKNQEWQEKCERLREQLRWHSVDELPECGKGKSVWSVDVLLDAHDNYFCKDGRNFIAAKGTPLASETLEYAAKWIENSLVGETDERIVEFGKSMAMSIRAAKPSKSDVSGT